MFEVQSYHTEEMIDSLIEKEIPFPKKLVRQGELDESKEFHIVRCPKHGDIRLNRYKFFNGYRFASQCQQCIDECDREREKLKSVKMAELKEAKKKERFVIL